MRVLFTVFALSLLACSVNAQTPSASSPNLRFVQTDDAPKAAGPYSQGVVAGGFLFVAGMTPRDPKTNAQVNQSFEAAANRVMESLTAVLRAEGLDWTDVVKTTVYLIKPEDFGPLNTVYAQHLGAGKPARSTVMVASLPGGALLEIDLVAKTRK